MEGKPARRWKDVVEYDLRVMGFGEKGMAIDRKTLKKTNSWTSHPLLAEMTVG